MDKCFLLKLLTLQRKSNHVITFFYIDVNEHFDMWSVSKNTVKIYCHLPIVGEESSEDTTASDAQGNLPLRWKQKPHYWNNPRLTILMYM